MTDPQYDPKTYRKCPTCLAATGEYCCSLSGKIVDGQPDGVRTLLPQPHRRRPARTYGIRGAAWA